MEYKYPLPLIAEQCLASVKKCKEGFCNFVYKINAYCLLLSAQKNHRSTRE